MKSVEWRFDPVPPSGSLTGGAAETFVFKPKLSAFVREVLQNSHDQRLNGECARVSFRLHEYLPGSDARKRVEQNLRWDVFDRHLSAVATRDDTMGLRVRRARAGLESRPLVALEISDDNTHGLVGGEQTRGENFAGLCRHVLDTPPGRSPGRGGSYGLGKAVLWLYSSFSTIMFYSRLFGPDEERSTRFIGRTVLPYHEFASERFAGLGWLGAPVATPAGEYAASVWDDQADRAAEAFGIAREGMTSGTSILVIGFREPYRDSDRDLDEVARDLVSHATRWFWPAVLASKPTLSVSAGVVRDGIEGPVYRAGSTAEIAGFVTARSAEDVRATAPTSGDIAERSIPFTVPALLDPKGDQLSGQVVAQFRLRVLRSDDPDAELANSVALMRGTGMVVDYRTDWARRPSDGQPYFAVLEAGRAHGRESHDDAAEDFLRASEPPAHDEWTITDAAKERYQPGIKSSLDDLAARVRVAIAEICEERPPSGQAGPAMLAKLFPLSSRGGGVRPQGPRFEEAVDGEVVGDTWAVRGRVTRVRGEGPWESTIALQLDVESGRPEPIGLASCTASLDGASLAVVDRQESALVEVPSHVDTFDFFVASVPLAEDLLRTRLVVKVQSRNASATRSGDAE